MKRILALTVLAVMLSVNAFAQAVDQAGNKLTSTLGDQNAKGFYRVSTDTTGMVQFANDTEIAYPYENIAGGASKTSYSLTSADSGMNIADYGGVTVGTTAPGNVTGSGTKYILPLCTTANLGLQFDIATAVKETITITPVSTADSIAYSIGGTGLAIGVGIKNSGSTAAGDGVVVACTGVGNWTVHNVTGTWATAP